MIKEFVSAWDTNKEELKKYFQTNKQSEYSSYADLVKLLFDIVINPYEEAAFREKFYTEEILTIDDGDYQGTQIFILHRSVYQPGVDDYVYTNTYYGSCSGCDTLLSINGYDDDIPNYHQVEDYMTLCLHLLQRCAILSDGEE